MPAGVLVQDDPFEEYYPMESDVQSKILEKGTTATLQYDILEYVVHAYSSKRIVHQNGRENITNVGING